MTQDHPKMPHPEPPPTGNSNTPPRRYSLLDKILFLFTGPA
ncbi:hypothetical protein DVS28_b0549 (plasmid) [Euzebya pacifica]|uniref:Uncharacterized protein n=1 Tax=Euzebya pacifica TaxID=1608957 RepID=A0A346Y742_9ACTN|nr:hypothetical protein DVS28_b0549 [Euzebya pacifica]